MRRTAESVVLTLCPPAPVERITSISMSAGLIWMSTSSASGMTATVMVEVWMRPCASVAGTRCTRWTPDSYFMRRVDRVAGQRDGGVLDAARRCPALMSTSSAFQPLPVRVAEVHLQHLLGEQAGLVPAGAGADLEDDVLLVVGVLGDEEDLELGLERVAALLEGRGAPPCPAHARRGRSSPASARPRRGRPGRP